MELKFTASGRLQFLAAIRSIRKANATAARQFRQRTEKALKRLQRFPASGAVVAEFPELPYREFYIKPYRFFYRVHVKTIWVVAVWHGAQIPQNPGDSAGARDD